MSYIIIFTEGYSREIKSATIFETKEDALKILEDPERGLAHTMNNEWWVPETNFNYYLIEGKDKW